MLAACMRAQARFCLRLWVWPSPRPLSGGGHRAAPGRIYIERGDAPWAFHAHPAQMTQTVSEYSLLERARMRPCCLTASYMPLWSSSSLSAMAACAHVGCALGDAGLFSLTNPPVSPKDVDRPVASRSAGEVASGSARWAVNFRPPVSRRLLFSRLLPPSCAGQLTRLDGFLAGVLASAASANTELRFEFAKLLLPLPLTVDVLPSESRSEGWWRVSAAVSTAAGADVVG
mmetsp:Transcript_20008/g.50897  ORF Transcript_20008/g.50897 Transcript_20008/m.50897 type:complete len:230 (+) Transcript_20008:219-908(+)